MDNNFIKEKKIYGGLLPTTKERQKFSFGAVFGYPKAPNEFDAGIEPKIKNQGATFICVAEGTTSAREPQEGMVLEEGFTIKNISELEGDPNWIYKGTNLDTGGKASKKGFLSREDSPWSIEKDGLAYCANPTNWASTYNDLALKHQTKDWFWIGTSGGVMFEKMISALYQFREEKRLLISGVIWNNEWTDQTYIDTEGTPAGGHCICILPKWINKTENFYDKGVLRKKGRYLKIQNSIGKEIGENGCQYFHEDIINKCFIFNAIMFQDMPFDLTPEQIKEKSKYYRASWIKKLLILISKYVAEIFK